MEAQRIGQTPKRPARSARRVRALVWVLLLAAGVASLWMALRSGVLLTLFASWFGDPADGFRFASDRGLIAAHVGPRSCCCSWSCCSAWPCGSFHGQGLASLAGLDGLFGLSFFWHLGPGLTAAGLATLAALPRLGFLGCEGKLRNDEAMRHIGYLPTLRMLMAQGTVAGDDGFAALSRSRTIEYIWGRECPNLTGRGFAALAGMPSLRGLAVSCKNVDDAALSTLTRFPALTQLMPTSVPLPRASLR